MSAYEALSPIRQRFVDEYLIDLQPGQAYLRAGYRCKPGKVASNNAFRLLEMAGIQAAIAEKRQAYQERLDISAERVLLEYARLAFFDLRKAAKWDKDGLTVFDSETLDTDTAAAIAEVSQTAGMSVRIKTHNKVEALRDLAKHLDLFRDKDATEELGKGLAALLQGIRNGAGSKSSSQ